jgi:predicted  nucleic acid-binding Zn-ribbon protein
MSQIKNCGTTAFNWQPKEGQADVQQNQENVSPNTNKTGVQAGPPKDQSKMTSAQALQKRELYSVSLRKQKKNEILNIKRTRNIGNLSKGKFLLKQ